MSTRPANFKISENRKMSLFNDFFLTIFKSCFKLASDLRSFLIQLHISNGFKLTGLLNESHRAAFDLSLGLGSSGDRVGLAK